jgi:2-iminobutanoate/2-iminopropanoate deaminase
MDALAPLWCARNLCEGNMIKRLRVEPISDYLERYRKARSFPVSIANGFVFVSGLPPFDPETGEIKPVAFEQQAERVLAQLKLCLEAAGSSLSNVLKCNVYCTPEPSRFAAFNAIYDRYFAGENPARIFVRCHHGRGRSMSRSIAWRWWGEGWLMADG